APIPFDLGPRTPLHLPQIARAALIQGSEYNISEGLIPEAVSTPTPAPGSVLLGEEAFIEISMKDVFEIEATAPAIAINLSAAAAGVAAESQAILDDKMKVFRTFCAAFDETAKQFPTGRMFRFAQEMSQSFLSHWASALNGDSQPPAASHPQQENPAVAYDDPRVFIRLHEKSPAWEKQPFAIRTHLANKLGIKLDAIPQASRTKTGWAIRPANLDIRNKIINEEACWAPALGADAIELATKWITYVVAECPRSLTDLLGRTVDYEAALKDEVEAQTGLRAV
ncbi:hypothetical protein BKA56DRAFT_436705, partial [Ilyonectria sp. MPI-CAGE-AT-0026]